MLDRELPADAHRAHLALVNGQVLTPNGWVRSVAIARNAIVALGADDGLRPYLAESTRVIDLGGKTVLPGLFDMHVHPTGAGLAEMQCPAARRVARADFLYRRCIRADA